MPRELPADATRWLRWAGEDLAVAEHISQDTDLVPRGACVFAHQAADKALKGLLVARGLDPPKLHDLDRLAAPLRLTTSDSTRLTFQLTRWAIEGRYPDDLDEAGRSDALRAVALARLVLAAAMSALGIEEP